MPLQSADSSKHAHPSLTAFLSFVNTRPLMTSVTLDGAVVKTGNPNQVPVDYYTHNKTLGGIINRLPPTD